MPSLTAHLRLFYATVVTSAGGLLLASGAHAMLPRDFSTSSRDTFAGPASSPGIPAAHSSSSALLIACIAAAVLAAAVVAVLATRRHRAIGLAQD